jgi:hypothetical protein
MDTRNGDELSVALTRLLQSQMGLAVDLGPLAAPA